MNAVNFVKWLEEKLLPNLPQKSVIVIDNATYHNKQEVKTPTSSSRKDVIIEWLPQKNIMCSDNMRKVELLDLVKVYKPPEKCFQIDRIIRRSGHEEIRLPPYHSDLNAI